MPRFIHPSLEIGTLGFYTKILVGLCIYLLVLWEPFMTTESSQFLPVHKSQTL